MKKFKDNERPIGKCYDCNTDYKNIVDLLIDDVLWEMINPTYHDGAGLLCPSCICNRLRSLGIKKFTLSVE